MKREVLVGDWVQQLRGLPDASVDLVVTSPPYWALRDYGVPGQLGLEPSWREHMQNLMVGFREVHRVLKPTGNLWVNYGDTVSAATVGSRDAGSWIGKGRAPEAAHPANAPNRLSKADPRKHKLGLAWRLRFMLNDELGFISRSDVVWHKPNSMPLSMKDRATPKYEMFFHFVKQQRYFFDLDAIRNPFAEATVRRLTQESFEDQEGGPKDYGGTMSQRGALENLHAKVRVHPVGSPDKGAPPGQRKHSAQRAEHETWEARRARGSKKGPAPGQKPSSIDRASSFNVRVRDAKRGISDMKWGALAGATPEEIANSDDQGNRLKTPRDDERDASSLAANDVAGRNGSGWKNANRPKRVKTLGMDGTPSSPGARLPPERHEPGGPDEHGQYNALGANPGDVWEIPTTEEDDAVWNELWTIPNQPLKEAHFATFPEELARRAILSSCPREVCASCGLGRRIATTPPEMTDVYGRPDRAQGAREQAAGEAGSHKPRGSGMVGTGKVKRHVTGYTDCGCNAGWVPGVVLDPFAGAFTTCLVAAKEGRGFIGIELNERYVTIGRRRLAPYMRPLTSFGEAEA